MKLSKRLRSGRLLAFGAAAVVLSLAVAGGAAAGVLENFEDGDHSGGYVPEPTNAGVVLTPDNTMNSPSDVGGSWSLRINTDAFFNFGTLRWDHGAVNDHLPEWQAGDKLLFDVFLGTFTDFAQYRWTYQPQNNDGSGQANSGPPDPNFHDGAGAWQTLEWTYPDAPGAPPYWIEWFSTNSNGPVEMWIDNIRIVPEPASIALLAMGAGLFALRRKRSY
jgi:hypothetical protein